MQSNRGNCDYFRPYAWKASRSVQKCTWNKRLDSFIINLSSVKKEIGNFHDFNWLKFFYRCCGGGNREFVVKMEYIFRILFCGNRDISLSALFAARVWICTCWGSCWNDYWTPEVGYLLISTAVVWVMWAQLPQCAFYELPSHRSRLIH